MPFHKYYQDELAYLRELGRDFARKYPGSARWLEETGTDPDVERLLEGVAFMTAGLRARIDQSGAHLAHGLAELVLPHYLRSLPASTIVEFAPNPKTLRVRQRIPAERPLLARAMDGTACRFRTCFPVDLWPVKVGEVRLDDSISGSPKLEVQLELFESSRVALAQ